MAGRDQWATFSLGRTDAKQLGPLNPLSNTFTWTLIALSNFMYNISYTGCQSFSRPYIIYII